MKRKSRRSGSMAPVMLAGAILLGAAAGVAYYVPIPGITYASPVSAPASQPKVPEPVADPHAERADSLARLETQLKAREETVDEKETQVSGLLKDLTVQKAEIDAVRKAVALYEAMPPYKAAPLMQPLDPSLAVQILRLLDDDQAAAILAYMSPDKGASLMNELMKPPASKSENE